MLKNISVCIPCYEMHGKGVKFLSEAIESVIAQSYSDFEIVISDNSRDDNIAELIASIKDRRLRYFKNSSPTRNMSTNVNNSIRMANNDIIKILFQDDLLYSKQCLGRVHEVAQLESVIWGSVGFNHTDEESSIFFDSRMPRIHPNMLIGENYIGAPSNIFFRKDCGELFDERMVWLMDCEFYYRLNKLAKPAFITEVMVTSRIWKGSETKGMPEETKKNEKAYVLSKHPEFSWSNRNAQEGSLKKLSAICGKILKWRIFGTISRK